MPAAGKPESTSGHATETHGSGEYGGGLDRRPAPARRTPLRRPLRVKMIIPAKTTADSVFWRSIKYSLFPPLGGG